MEQKEEKQKDEARQNKEYKSPEFVIYGNIAEITRSNVSNNMNDKGAGSTSMT